MLSDRARYERTREKIMQLGLVISGTIRETYLLCGKEGCACAKSESARHGPYYLWNRKVKGRLTSKSISKDQLSLFEGWIENRRLLEELVQELLDLGSKIAIGSPQEIDSGNSNRLTSAKRGK